MSTFIPLNTTRAPGCLVCGDGEVRAREPQALKGELAAFAGGRVTLGGAEPCEEPKLVAIIEALRRRGAEEIVCESEGVRFADPAFTARLFDAGLSAVRLRLGALETRAWERSCGCPIHLERAWAGARAIIDAGLSLSVELPVARSNVASVRQVVSEVALRLPEVTSLTLRPVAYTLPSEESAHGADVLRRAREEMVPIEGLAKALGDALDAAQEAALKVSFDARAGLPLCALEAEPGAITAVRKVKGERGLKPEACGSCALLERCAGQGAMQAHLFGAWPVKPFYRAPRALIRNTSPEPVSLYSPGLPSRRYGSGHKAEIRVVMPCNQDCTFCFVNREAPSPDLEVLEGALEGAKAEGVSAVVFTGGEPTLSPHLVALVARAKALDIPCRGIQTNALRLATRSRAEALVDAGLNHAHVSLHARDPQRYRAITGFGEPVDAARGARHLVELGVEVSISLVICRENVDHMAATLSFIRESIGPVKVVLSVAREQHGLARPWDSTLLSYGEAAGAMVVALEEGRRLGLDMGSAGTCSMPPCVLPPDKLARFAEEVLVQHREMSWGSSDEEAEHVDANVFVAVCEGCELRARCPGIQRTYLERRGGEEFRALRMEQITC